MSTSNDVEDDGTAAGTASGGSRRRRGSHRAVSRPAGPPAGAPAAPAQPQDPAPAEVAEHAPEASEPAAPRTRRASRLPLFQAAAEPSAAEASATAEPSDAAEPQVPAPQGPSEPAAPSRPRRRRAASRPAGPPVDAPAAEQPVASEEPAAEAPAQPHDEPAGAPVVELAVDPLEATAAAEELPSAGEAAEEVGEEVADAEVAAELDDDSDASDDSDDETGSDDEDGVEDGASRGRRGRRRRGGRGRRRRGGEDAEDDAETGAETATDDVAAADETSDAPAEPASGDAVRPDGGADDAGDSDDEPDDSDASDDSDDADDAEDAGSGSSRRRRRRRRRGAGGADEAEDAPESEAPAAASSRRSRSRRSSSSSSSREGTEASDVTAVKGSTRLEAKRQRRRDGRDGGRRPRVLSEAEFLARRESVERTMVVRTAGGRSQVAVLEDGVLVEHYAARKQQTSMIGNVHLGRVQNVLPSMEAAFVDIGRGRNAVLYAGEVDWEAAGLTGQAKKIESALKSGDPVLVQVTKDPVGHKGARLTSQVSLPGRYLVYVPGGTMTGISRKLPDTERSRLKSILKEVVPEEAGVIVRTAAEGASEAELRRDVERLTAQWEEISARAEQVTPPTLLHGEPDLVIKVVRDVFNEDFARLVVEGDEAWESIEPYVASVAPDLAERVSRWEDGEGAGAAGGAFAHFRVDEQIAKALERKVWLPSGGSLVIDRTEAMTVVDVNTGRFTGSGGNLEETVTRNNLEAAEEIVRQLRLRDIGGIVVVDFIDMVLESNRDLVVRRLVECLGRDRSKHQVAEVTSLGLVQMTRKRVGQGLLETFSEPCEHCAGRGVVVQDDLAAVGGAGSGSGHSHGAVPHAPSGGRSASRSEGRSENRSEGRSEARDKTGAQSREGSREPSRDGGRGREGGRGGARDEVREKAHDGGREPVRGAAEPPAAEAPATGEPRSREEAARDAVREAMNGIAAATLRPARGEGEHELPSLDAAALLAAFGASAPPVDDEPVGSEAVGVVEVVEVVETEQVEVLTTLVPEPEPEPSAVAGPSGAEAADEAADESAGGAVDEPGAPPAG